MTEIFTRRLCSGCHDLARALEAAGVSYTEWDCDCVDGLAEWAFRGAPDPLPAVWVGGAWIAPECEDARELARLAIEAAAEDRP